MILGKEIYRGWEITISLRSDRRSKAYWLYADARCETWPLDQYPGVVLRPPVFEHAVKVCPTGGTRLGIVRRTLAPELLAEIELKVRTSIDWQLDLVELIKAKLNPKPTP